MVRWPLACYQSEDTVELKELMAMIDELSALETERLSLDRKSKALKDAENDFKARIMKEMNYLGITVIAGNGGRRASVQVSIEPVVHDWGQVLQYIKETEAMELLHRRLTVSAVKERWESGVNIPGVDRYEEHKLTLS